MGDKYGGEVDGGKYIKPHKHEMCQNIFPPSSQDGRSERSRGRHEKSSLMMPVDKSSDNAREDTLFSSYSCRLALLYHHHSFFVLHLHLHHSSFIMPVEFDLEEQEQLTTENGEPNVTNYGTTAAATDNNGTAASSSSDDEDDESYDFEQAEQNFRRSSKALPNVLGQLHASNVWLSSRNLVVSTVKGIDRTESGHFANDEQHTHYKSIPSLVQERVALVCDANLHAHDKGRLYYDETAFYNNQVVPYFVVTVNPFIFQNVMHEVWHSTSVPCGMYFCCQGGDGAHTGVAHEDFVSINFAWGLVALVFLGILVAAALPGDEEWNLNGF